MRVLHVNSGNMYGGVETLLVTLARERSLAPDMEPHFAACFCGRYTEELEGLGVGVHVLGPARTRLPWTIWRARRNLQAVLRKHHFDVVLCHAAWNQAI